MCVCLCIYTSEEGSFVSRKSRAEQLFKRTLISKSGNSQEKNLKIKRGKWPSTKFKNKRMDILEAKGMKEHLRTVVSIRPSHLKKKKKELKKKARGRKRKKFKRRKN